MGAARSSEPENPSNAPSCPPVAFGPGPGRNLGSTGPVYDGRLLPAATSAALPRPPQLTPPCPGHNTGYFFPDQEPPPVADCTSPDKPDDTTDTSDGPCDPGLTSTNSTAMMMIPVRKLPTSRLTSAARLHLALETELRHERHQQVADQDTAPEPAVLQETRHLCLLVDQRELI